MPWGDGTGPRGLGPMTGRGMGYCAGSGRPGYTNPGYGYGRGFGWGRGYGRGYGRGFGWGRGWGAGYGAYPVGAVPGAYAPAADPAAEKRILENQVKAMEAELDLLRKRMAELDSDKE